MREKATTINTGGFRGEAAILIRAIAPFAHVVEMAQSVSHDGVLGPCDDDVEFAFGLDMILDGLERKLARL